MRNTHSHFVLLLYFPEIIGAVFLTLFYVSWIFNVGKKQAGTYFKSFYLIIKIGRNGTFTVTFSLYSQDLTKRENNNNSYNCEGKVLSPYLMS